MEQLFPDRVPDLDPYTIYDALELPPGDERSFVAVNMVSSVDGKITLDRELRTETLGSAVDRALMKRLRRHFDAVLRGAETVRASPYFPGVPDDLAAARERAGEAPQPLAVVMSASLDLPWEAPFFRDGGRKPVVLTTSAADPARRAEAARHAHVEKAGDDRVDFHRALEILHSRYGVRRLLVEGGAAVNYALVQAGLLDTLFWTLAPKLSGYRDDLTMIEGERLFSPIPRLRLETLYRHEDELFFRWGASH